MLPSQLSDRRVEATDPAVRVLPSELSRTEKVLPLVGNVALPATSNPALSNPKLSNSQRRVEGFDPAQGVAQFRVFIRIAAEILRNPKLSNSLGGVEAFDPALGKCNTNLIF